MAWQSDSPRWRRFWMFLGWVWLAVILYLALVPLPQVMPPVSYSDKVVHFTVFGGLMVWFTGLVPPSRFGWLLAGLLLYGVGMEALQSLVPNRQAEFADLLADFGGLMVGLWLARCGLARWPFWVERLAAVR